MILRHIDEGIPEVMGEVEDFEIEHGRVEDLIKFEHSWCLRCYQQPGRFENLTYVITRNGNILWWHTDGCFTK